MCGLPHLLSCSEANLYLRCRRLDLTCLCYLWQRPQGDLLSEMIEAGMVCVLIKVAGIGLTVKHLGKTLSEMQHTLVNLVRCLLNQDQD